MKGKILSRRLVILFVVLGIGYSCKKDPSPKLDMGYDYFPTDIGKWVIYDVDSIVYDDFNNTVVTYTYQVKEIIESTFLDNEGRETQRIERYKRDSTSQPWVIKDVWFANLTASTAEKVEENVRFVKLTFPVKSGKTWDGNAFNTYETWNYQFSSIDVPYTATSLSFDSTVTVLQIDEDLKLVKDYSIEIYAKHVGMIYKNLVHLEQDMLKPDWSDPDRGYDYTMKVNSYGN